MQKEQITHAAVAVLIDRGLAEWTVASVAEKAGCAKGLVHYHHKTKEALLTAVAEALATTRANQRIAALKKSGTGALDHLWGVLEKSAKSGRTRAYLSLLGHSSSLVRQAARLPPGTEKAAAEAIGRAFAIDRPDETVVRSLWAALDGLEEALLADSTDREALQAAFHQVWLMIL